MRADILALPLLLLSPLALASSSHQRSEKRHHKRLINDIDEHQAEQRSLAERNHGESLAGRGEGHGEFEGRGQIFGNATGTLSKRQSFTGRGTFYYTGLGACGQYSQDSDYMVALNSAQYGGGYPGPNCFKWITVQANGVTVGGVQILDECPTCGWGDLDLSPGLFKRFADEGAGVVSLTWWFDGSSPQPSTTTTTWTPPTTTWTPPSSTWSPTTTWTPPPTTTTTTTTVQSTTTTTTTPPPSSSSTTTSVTTTSATNTTSNPFAVVNSYNATMSANSTLINSTGTYTSASPSQTEGNTVPIVIESNGGNNLQAFSGLVTNYGQIIVVGASN